MTDQKINLDLMLSVNQYNMEKEMKKYNFMHDLDEKAIYCTNIDQKSKKGKQELAEYINKNYNKMDDVEKKLNVLKCLDTNEVNKILLLFELKNYKQTSQKTMSLEEFKLKAFRIFNRYQSKAGGFLIEDREWIVHDSTSIKHEVELNELLFENTIDPSDVDDIETDAFLKYLVRKLNSIAKNINVELRQKHKKKIINLLIWVTDKNVESAKDVIGL